MSGIMSSREYIRDLTTGSTSAGLINDGFGKLARNLPIFSFYETLHMSMGISSGLIVNKNSAILGAGFNHERVQYINANHRDIVKFDSPDDPNYLTLKNAIVGAVQDLTENGLNLSSMFKKTMHRLESTKSQIKALATFLGVSEQPDEQYTRMDGSCQWIDDRDDFQNWREPQEHFPIAGRYLIMKYIIKSPFTGCTGKTFLASHVMDELEQFHLECSSYFFHVGNKTSRSLGHFLRSMVFQMAVSNSAVRKALTELCMEGTSFDMDDARTIWNKVYRKAIFDAPIRTPQYWAIDALDECAKYQELFTMIKGVNLKFPLRIFITSRKVEDMHILQRQLESFSTLISFEIPARDSGRDLATYIRTRVETLPIDTESDKTALSKEMVQKSNGSFLWVRLVLDELQHVYTRQSIMQVMQGIPEGMIPYYERTVAAMAERKMEKHIAKTVLTWTFASTRTLNISELSQALKLDINSDLSSAKGAVEGLCGQMVTLSEPGGFASLVHPTAREFLLTEKAGEFRISRPAAHERIALACLRLLSSAEMQPPRTRRSLSKLKQAEKPSPLLDYAITQFSEHVYSASAESDTLLEALDRFLKTNSLSWIERIAKMRDLHYLIRASRNFRGYLDRRAKYSSPIESSFRNIDSWTIDISRLVTKFGSALLQDSTSIFFIIPPLCPLNSAICRQFGRRADGLSVVGTSSTTWDDCIASVNFRQESIAASVSCGENSIAVGMESGDINLYNPRSCQKEKVIKQKFPVDLVHFTRRAIVACTTKFIMLFDLEGNTVWKARLRFRCTILTSVEDVVISVSQHGHLLKWDIATGNMLEDQAFTYRSLDDEVEELELRQMAPSVWALSMDAELLAFGYTMGTICLWEVESGELIGWVRDDEMKLPSLLLFNSNPDIHLLLSISVDHVMSIYDSWSGNKVHTHTPTNCGGILSAACSPDGRTLATTDKLGSLHIWDFEALDLLYHVMSPATNFRLLNFTSDGSSVVDITDTGMNIWSPATLIRKNIEDDYSVSEDFSGLTATEGQGQFVAMRANRITALSTHASQPLVFAGKHNGQIVAYNSRNGQHLTILYTHPFSTFVTHLQASKSNHIASCDANGTVDLWNLGTAQPASLKPLQDSAHVLRFRAEAQVHQICFSDEGKYLLVSCAERDEVFATSDGHCVGSMKHEKGERSVWRWLPHTSTLKDSEFILVSGSTLSRFRAANFPAKVEPQSITLRYGVDDGSQAVSIPAASTDYATKTMILEFQHMLGFSLLSSTFFFDLEQITAAHHSAVVDAASTTNLQALPPAQPLTKSCKHFIGVSSRSKRCVFLHQNSWISSVKLGDRTFASYDRHFFVPTEFLSSKTQILPILASDDSIVFCLHGEIAIVKNSLTFAETLTLAAP
ncbi:NACHT and WD domain protein [Apiospora arundinis]